MRLIFENGDEEDYVELVLTDQEIEDLKRRRGVLMEFPMGNKVLNLFIRNETVEVENAVSERESSEE